MKMFSNKTRVTVFLSFVFLYCYMFSKLIILINYLFVRQQGNTDSAM